MEDARMATVQERALLWIAKHKDTGGGLAQAFVHVAEEALAGTEAEVVTRELALPDSAWAVKDEDEDVETVPPEPGSGIAED